MKKKPISFVFIRDSIFGWRPAIQTQTSNDGLQATISLFHYKDEQSMTSDAGRGAIQTQEGMMINLKDYHANVLPLQNVDHCGTIQEYPDMVKLPFLHEVRFWFLVLVFLFFSVSVSMCFVVCLGVFVLFVLFECCCGCLLRVEECILLLFVVVI